MNVLSLFDGISCGQVALNRAGIKYDKYYASEIDPYAIQITMKNYPNTIQLGDVTLWRSWTIDWSNIDLVIGGSPCQSLSIVQAKTRQNLDGKSKLFFVFVDILNHIKEYNPDVKFLFENVASMNVESKKTIECLLGNPLVYQNSNAFSAQNRPRLYSANFHFNTISTPSVVLLKDVLEENVDEKYFYNCGFDFLGQDKMVAAILHINGHDILKRVSSMYFKCPTLTTCGGGNTQKKVYVDGRCRKLTPVEYERLQTLPDGYTYGVSNIHRYSVCGNGWTVDVIAHIFSFLNNLK